MHIRNFVGSLVLTSASFLLGLGVISTNSTAAPASPDQAINIRLAKAKQGVKLKWGQANNNTRFTIYRSAGPAQNSFKKIGETTDNEYIDKHPGGQAYHNSYLVKRANATTNQSKLLTKTDKQGISLDEETFGPNMKIYSEDDVQQSKDDISTAFAKQKSTANDVQFGSDRYAFYFLPGDYSSTDRDYEYQMGYYTTISGLGASPDQTTLPNIKVPAYMVDDKDKPTGNATQNFWTAVENVQIGNAENHSDTPFLYATSQATPLRRTIVNRQTKLNDEGEQPYASGGFAADSTFNDQIQDTSQQQYYFRNSNLSNWGGNGGYNFVFQGDTGAPNNDWENNSHDNEANTPVIREKPFLYFADNDYKIFVPGIRQDATDVSWKQGETGNETSLSLQNNDFYVAKSGSDTSSTINAALDKGQSIFLTPGVYHLDSPLHVSKAGTVISGTGMATLQSDNDQGAVQVDNVANVTLASFMVDQGQTSQSLVQVGKPNDDESGNPVGSTTEQTLLADIFVRNGGSVTQNTSTNRDIEINNNNVIGDDLWLWRADHGYNIGWNNNVSQHGVVVNGANVTMYGLFNEHHKNYQTLWHGENGKTYFYQSEDPYDPPTQGDWMSHSGATKGYASYKVGDNVNNHYASGLGVYAVFNRTQENVHQNSAIEVPDTAGVKIHDAAITKFAANGGIDHIINNKGTGTTGNGAKQIYDDYSNGD